LISSNKDGMLEHVWLEWELLDVVGMGIIGYGWNGNHIWCGWNENCMM